MFLLIPPELCNTSHNILPLGFTLLPDYKAGDFCNHPQGRHQLPKGPPEPYGSSIILFEITQPVIIPVNVNPFTG